MSIPESGKIIVILGPTSSGKTRLAVQLAAKFAGEIVSADSRQVYRGMDVGTGKDLAEYSAKLKVKSSKLKVVQIPYHLIDVVNPNQEFNLAKYKKMAEAAIDDILRQGKLPLLVGGSGLYLQAVVDDFKLTNIKADRKLRSEFEKLSVRNLFAKLEKLNSGLAAKINQSDRGNKRRLVRYLEILSAGAETLGEKNRKGKYDALLIGLDLPVGELNQRIEYRLLERLEKEGLVAEVQELHDDGLSWHRLESFGLEYKFVSQHLQGKLSYDEMVKKLNIAIRQFARRQRSWFRRWERQGKKIHWVTKRIQAEQMIKKYIA
jgi:tRNA dimethylallyltransferase